MSSVVELDTHRRERRYKDFYTGHQDLAKDTSFLHTQKHINDFRKDYISAWIKLLSKNISKGD